MVVIEGLCSPADLARKTVVAITQAIGKDATPTVIAALHHPSLLAVPNALNVRGPLYAKDPHGAVGCMGARPAD